MFVVFVVVFVAYAPRWYL